jgi:hypothetical protein
LPLDRRDLFEVTPMDIVRFEDTLVYRGIPTGGEPFSIVRPPRSIAVWTPVPCALILDNGPGTYSATVTVNGRNGRVPLGPWSRITAGSNEVDTLIFQVGEP